MKYTPGQVQEMLRLSPATFRHWKKLPPLAGRNGYKPCFSPADLLALAVVRTLTEDGGISVGKLQPTATDLFKSCDQSWAGLERSVLLLYPNQPRIAVVPEAQPIAPDGLTISVPLRPIITALRERLLLEEPEAPQEPLRFPPTAVGGRERGRGAR
jgi:DNA-binding transcriptional MerR regulator